MLWKQNIVTLFVNTLQDKGIAPIQVFIGVQIARLKTIIWSFSLSMIGLNCQIGKSIHCLVLYLGRGLFVFPKVDRSKTKINLYTLLS